MFDKGNEITVRIKGKIEDLYKLLKERNFNIKEGFEINDIYFIPKDLRIEKMSIRDILAKAVIVRNFIYKDSEDKKITFKVKTFDQNGDIISQEAINCGITDTESAKKLLKAIGYKEIMNIKENDIVYIKDGMEIVIKDVENGEKLIEIETRNIPGLRNIQELKQKVNELDIPIETDDYFVKKAEIELKRVLEG